MLEPDKKREKKKQKKVARTSAQNWVGLQTVSTCAVLVGGAIVDGAQRGLVRIVELKTPCPYIFSL